MLLRNSDPQAPISMVETHADGARTFAVISASSTSLRESIRAQAEQKGYQYLGDLVSEGKPAIALSIAKPEKDVRAEWTQNGQFAAVDIKTKDVNIWFWRGLMGLSGQLMQLKQTIDNNDLYLRAFALLNLVANSLSMIFGAQRRDDKDGLAELSTKFDHIAEKAGEKVPAGPDGKAQLLPIEKADSVEKELTGVMGFIKKNSVKVQHTLRLIASGVVFFDGFRKYRESGFSGEIPVRLFAGGLILPGKIIGMLAKNPDPDKLPEEKKGLKENFLVNANQIGSLVELTGFSLLAYEGTKAKPNPKKGGAMETSPWQTAGGATFAASYMVQSVAPLSKFVFPVNTAFRAAAEHMRHIPAEERDRAAVGMASAMYQQVPKLRREGMAKILSRIYQETALPPNAPIKGEDLYANAQHGVSEPGKDVAQTTQAPLEAEQPGKFTQSVTPHVSPVEKAQPESHLDRAGQSKESAVASLAV